MSAPDFRVACRQRLIGIADRARFAGESGASAAVAKFLAEERNAIKDALSIHALIQDEQELAEMRRLRDELEAARQDLHTSGRRTMGAPPTVGESPTKH